MKIVKILFPQIVIEIKSIEVSDEEFENLIDHIDVENFVWNNMTEQEQSWTQGKKWVESYIENCGCGIKPAD